MLRDLSAVLIMVLAGGVTATAASCDHCDDCGSDVSCGTSTGCDSDISCSSSDVMQPTSHCCTQTSCQTICTAPDVEPCTLLAPSASNVACTAGEQKCKAGTFVQCVEVAPHPDACTTPASWTCTGDPPACGGASWATVLPGDGKETARAIALDGNGNLVVAGTASGGALHVNGKKIDVAAPGAFVAKADATGAPIWALALDGASSAFVATDAAGAIYVTGSVAFQLKVAGHVLEARKVAPAPGINSGYLVKLGPAGQWVWGKIFHSPKKLDPSAVVSWPQGLVVAGTYVGGLASFGSAQLGNASGSDGFVASFDPATGDAKWATNAGTGSDDALSAIAIADDATIFVAGSSTPLAAPGQPQCAPPHVLLAALNGAGSLLWIKEKVERPVSLAAIAVEGNDIALVGQVEAGFQEDHVFFPVGGYLGLFDPNGNERWARPTAWEGTAVAFDPQHLLLVAGAATSGDAFAMKLDTDGQVYYEHGYAPTPLAGEATSSIGIFGLVAGSDGSAFIAGGLRGSAALGLGLEPHRISSTVKTDPFFARLDP